MSDEASADANPGPSPPSQPPPPPPPSPEFKKPVQLRLKKRPAPLPPPFVDLPQELPLDGPDGRPLVAEASAAAARRRDALADCSLVACRMLDALGEFEAGAGGGGGASSRERRLRQLADNDFLEEEEDAFLDRTGELERKRLARIAMAEAASLLDSAAAPAARQQLPRAETFQDLAERRARLADEIAELEARLRASATAAAATGGEGGGSRQQLDELEEYMRTIRAGGLDHRTRTQMKLRLMAARKEEALAVRLMERARPADLSSVGAATRARQAASAAGRVRPRMRAFVGEEFDEEAAEVVDEGGPDKDLNKEDKDLNKEDKDLNREDKDLNKEDKDLNKEEICDEQAARPSLKAPLKLLRPSAAASADALGGPQRLRPPAWLADADAGDDADAAGRRRPAPRIIGPEVVDDQPAQAPASAKRPQQRRRRPVDVAGVDVDGYDPMDPDFALWLPPDDQSGDGSTALNRKLGY